MRKTLIEIAQIENFHMRKIKRKKDVRTKVLMIFLIIFSACIFYRLFNLQVFQHEDFTALAEGQHSFYEKLFPKRGEILVRDSKTGDLFPLATNKELFFIYAIPRHIEREEKIVDELSPLLFEYKEELSDKEKKKLNRKHRNWVMSGKYWVSDDGKRTSCVWEKDVEGFNEKLDKDSVLSREIGRSFTNFKKNLKNKVSDKDDPYVVLGRKLNDRQVEKILSFDFEGVYLESESWRYYPEGTLASHILGYFGYSDDVLKGHYGIEGYFNDKLSGKKGYLETEKDLKGAWISIGKRKLELAKDGNSVVLTIDRKVQYKTDLAIQKAVEEYQAEKGSIIVQDPTTGKIIAMSSYPTFDPNEYSEVLDISFYKNPAIFDQYEPGSAFKPIVMAAALDIGIINPSSSFYCKGYVNVGKYKIKTSTGEAHGNETMTEILEHSCNVGMVWVSQKVGLSKVYHYIENFGFGKDTGITLDKESSPIIKDIKDWNKVDLATSGFGQGAIVITPLQLISAISAIANKGRLFAPSIVSEIVYSDGTNEKIDPKFVRQVISEKTALNLSAMLVSAIEKGYGDLAKVEGYRIAGKTGTAQVANPGGGYSESKKITSFVGFGPVDDPRFTILVKLDNPKKAKWGATSAAPVFKELAEELFQYFEIPPSIRN
ncbi:penicillin-binding protein 2 [bacterium (Candidatus Torokbacteria) CG_4_10_14_0_2_um_filter_35_8]|nr:MAG: penicillin-binding protein 2 [bacterium (Candidatus Torokbacteria) CG_4_10_14_0_2_um_filter_35_8]